MSASQDVAGLLPAAEQELRLVSVLPVQGREGDILKQLDRDNVRYVVLHTTASPYGSFELIDAWHRDRGWDGIGYHKLITNCYGSYEAWKEKRPEPKLDGDVFLGRPFTVQGAHARGWNDKSIGVAMVGVDGQFSGRQIQAALDLCCQLIAEYPIEKVIGHCETGTPKTCPDLDMDWFRNLLACA